jgi:hypothetical protein
LCRQEAELKRALVIVATAVELAACPATEAEAQGSTDVAPDYPRRPIRLIAQFPPGSSTYNEARILHELTATQIVEAVTPGKTTCEAVVRACLHRIEQREPEILVWQYLDTEQ